MARSTRTPMQTVQRRLAQLAPVAWVPAEMVQAAMASTPLTLSSDVDTIIEHLQQEAARVREARRALGDLRSAILPTGGLL